MNWTDYKNYKHHHSLENLRNIVIEEYHEIKETLDFDNALSVQEKYGHLCSTKEFMETLWFSYPIFDNENRDERYAQYWPKTIEELEKVPGVLNAVINFIGPHSNVMDHVDHDLVDNLNEKTAIGTMIGIQMPSSDPDVVGFHVNNEIKSWNTGDIVSFDGYKNHGGWNRTDKWRVTLLIDIDKTYWNL